MSLPTLKVERLTVQPTDPRKNPVVQDVSFDIKAGEIVCVVGESGSGKSVTALSIMGLLPRTELVSSSGTVLIEGENVLTATPKRLRELRATRMSMVFQEPMTALNPVQS